MERYVKLGVDGEIQFIDLNEEIALEEMKKHVGGWVEALYIPHNQDVIVFMFNEEGRLNGLANNWTIPNIQGNILIGRLAREGDGSFLGVPLTYPGVGNKDKNTLLETIRTFVVSYNLRYNLTT